MADLDTIQKEEDDMILSGFIYQIVGGRTPVFSKVAKMDRDIVSSIHDKWNAPANKKVAIMEWHRDNTESRHQDFISLLFEANEVGMTEDVIDVMTYAYDERLATSVEQIYRAIELQAEEGIPLEMAVYLTLNKTAEEIEEEIEKRKEEEKARKEAYEKSKITMGNLQRKWEQPQGEPISELFR